MVDYGATGIDGWSGPLTLWFYPIAKGSQSSYPPFKRMQMTADDSDFKARVQIKTFTINSL